MRAHLARHARRVLVQHSRSPSCALYSAPTRQRQLPRPIAPLAINRTFFDGLFSFTKAPREVRQPDVEPGWMNIMVWRSRMLDSLRPPPNDELIKTWNVFFNAKLASRAPLNATQAIQCHRLLDYLVQQSSEAPAQDSPKLRTKDLTNALTALLTLRPRERSAQHLDFAKRIYSILTSENSSFQNIDTKPGSNLWAQYIQTICLYGGSKEALQLLHSDWDRVVDLAKNGHNLVTPVTTGLGREGHEADLAAFVDYAEKNGIPFDKDTQLAVVSFFAERNQVAETKHWFDKPPAAGKRAAEVYPLVALFAARNNVTEWAVPYFLELGDTKPEKPYWDGLLQAILIMGKGLKQVETMMSHMADSKGPVKADTTTINGLLRAAVSLKDTILAEDILSLAADNDLKRDGETYLIQMGLRVDAGYLPGVQAAYKSVKKFEPWQSNPERWWEYCQLLNKYLNALCAQKTPDFKLIVDIVHLAEEDQVQLDPDTVAALCVGFLENEQPFDVMDTLSVHAFQFSAEEREVIQEAFTQFCLNPETSTSRAWTAYQLLRQFFQDLSFERRVSLLDAFFARKRPDMASHVFGHMRQHRNNDYHPKHDNYVRFFECLSRNPDTEALEMVFNMLKMDTTVQPGTKLYTALMLAHTACDRPLQSMDFWNEITSSREGPTYASLEAAFWSLERRPGGAKTARKLWKRIESMDVDVPPKLYNSYVGAIAGSGEVQAVEDVIMMMQRATDVEPNFMTLGVAFNALPGQQLQASFKSWAKGQYPEAWATLEQKGKRMTADSLCKFKIDRDLTA